MEITCEYEISRTHYRCIITKITFNRSNKVHVYSEHKGKDNVPEVEIRDIYLDKFPRGIGETFPSLERLWIIGCGIKDITRRDFVGLSKLKTLNLKRNMIEEIHEDTFQDLSNLKYLSLSYNNIRFVHPKAFKSLVKIETLSLQSNSFIDGTWNDLTNENNRRDALYQIEGKCKRPTSPKPMSSNFRSDDSHRQDPDPHREHTLIDKRSIYVGNVSVTVDEHDLKAHFRHCGRITYILIPRVSGHKQGYGFVEFESSESVYHALDMNNSYLKDYQIYVCRKRPSARESSPKPRREVESKQPHRDSRHYK